MFRFVIVLSILAVALGLPTNSSKTDVEPRIFEGEETDIQRNPWQLALLYRSRHYCGAVEIHSRWALTTAHCLEGAEVDYLSVRAGSTTKSFGGQVIDVRRVYNHPDFNRRTMDYDFALLELDEPITVQTASPAALPEPHSELIEGDLGVITGWGLLSPEGTSPEILHRAEVKVVGPLACRIYYPLESHTDRMFCIKNVDEGGNDACRGDGGGPVIINGRLEGLMSWGNTCGGSVHYPGVNARVSSVLNWIYETSGI